jgi:hypothetical protein
VRYIKKFESFSSERVGDELVTYITYDKFESLLSNGEIEEITDAEVERIKYLIDLEDPSPIIKYEKVKRFRFDKVKSCVSFDMNFGRENGTGYIIFYKFKDEWWIVELCTNDGAQLGHQFGLDENVRRAYKAWLLDSMEGIEKWADTELEKVLSVT